MATDTRPSVTVVGDFVRVEKDGTCYIDIDYVPDDIQLDDGDEVEVTIWRHERLPANPWPAPREQAGE